MKLKYSWQQRLFLIILRSFSFVRSNNYTFFQRHFSLYQFGHRINSVPTLFILWFDIVQQFSVKVVNLPKYKRSQIRSLCDVYFIICIVIYVTKVLISVLFSSYSQHFKVKPTIRWCKISPLPILVKPQFLHSTLQRYRTNVLLAKSSASAINRDNFSFY